VAIRGSINSSDIERGFARIELGMDSVKGKTKSFNADLSRMSAISIGLANNLIGVGMQGAEAMIKLASGAPAVAGSMAQMEVTAGKLGRTMGVVLSPMFDLASDAFSGFVAYIDENSASILGFIESVTDFLRDPIKDVQLKFTTLYETITGDEETIEKEKIGTTAEIFVEGAVESLGLPSLLVNAFVTVLESMDFKETILGWFNK